MDHLVEFALVVFTSFITLINPLGVMPVFMTMTANLESSARKKTAIKAMIVAFGALMLFAFTGQVLFKFFGISVDSFRIVGGIIFFMLGQDMLQARLGRTKIKPEDVKEYVGDISVTPLAIPMICGPGAITNAIVMMEDANTFGMKATLIIMILVVCALTLFVLWFGARIIKLLGDTGNKILMRLMGLIVMVIAVEFFLSGFTPIFRRIMGIE